MTSNLPPKRPTCEQILKSKNSWALNKEELEINDQLENIIASKEHENEFTIYSILRPEINLIQNSSPYLSYLSSYLLYDSSSDSS
jgi:hypothetical protein